MNKTEREFEKKFLKSEIKKMMTEIGVSKTFFKRNLPRVSGQGYYFKRDKGGKKPSLRQQYSLLKVLLESHINMKEMLKEQKENMVKDQEFKAYSDKAPEENNSGQNLLLNNLKSVFDRDK